MTGLDPEDTEESPAGPQDTQSSDQSKPGLRKAWDAWTSRPENNAALLQFGLAMLQPRAPGQSGVGQFANAVGQGAEASDRNLTTQRTEADAESKRTVEQQKADATTSNVAAYGRQVDTSGGTKKAPGMQATLAAQKAFNSWAIKPDDLTGMTGDPVTAAVAKQFPDVKTKADLLNNPAAVKVAREIFKNQLAEPSDDGEATPAAVTPSAPAAAAPSAAPQPRVIYDKQGKAYQWDGIQGHKPVPM